MPGKANLRITEPRAPVFTLLLGKQTDPGSHHDNTRWLGSMSAHTALPRSEFLHIALAVGAALLFGIVGNS